MKATVLKHLFSRTNLSKTSHQSCIFSQHCSPMGPICAALPLPAASCYHDRLLRLDSPRHIPSRNRESSVVVMLTPTSNGSAMSQ